MKSEKSELIEYHNGLYCISTDKARLDRDFIHGWLSNVSYWAAPARRGRNVH